MWQVLLVHLSDLPDQVRCSNLALHTQVQVPVPLRLAAEVEEPVVCEEYQMKASGPSLWFS